MNFQRVTIFSFFFSFLLINCSSSNRKIENLHAFAKVYGYVRWFYPGDEASEINWDRFAVYGVQKVENARNEKELEQTLVELFKPIAPAIQIGNKKEVTNFNLKSITPRDTIGLIPVAWRHYGVYLGKQSNIYESERTNRKNLSNGRQCLTKSIDEIAEFKNKEIKLIVSLKGERNSRGNVYLYLLSYDNKSGGSFEAFTSSKSVIRSDGEWQEFEKTIKVRSKDNSLTFGLGIDNSTIWIDEVKLMAGLNNQWKPIKLENGNFSKGLDGWDIEKSRFDIRQDSTQSKNGKYALKINQNIKYSKPGEYIKKDIGSNLVCIMPIVLYGDSMRTYPGSDVQSLKFINEQLSKIPADQLNTDYTAVKLANVIIAWNVLEHFYPYFDVVHTNWEKELSQTLQNVYSEKSKWDFYKDLSKMIAGLEDGHGMVAYADNTYWGLPVKVDWIENKIVVTTSSDTSLFKKGDIIKTVDHKSALEELQYQESLISGSPQLKRFRALNVFGSNFSHNIADITLIRDKEEKSLQVPRTTITSILFNPLSQEFSPEFRSLGDSIYYLNNCNWQKKEVMSKLLTAKGIIINRLRDNFDLLPHIIKEPVESAKWNIPENTYPDRQNTVFDTSRWKVEPKKPYIKANLVFLTNPGHVSAGETFLGIIDHYKLGTLVGDTTAGTNGNINMIPLMGDYSIMWTGMKVIKHDGSQHHLIGFKPDYPVSRTIQAIKEGRDEYLEKAKMILEEKIKIAK